MFIVNVVAGSRINIAILTCGYDLSVRGAGEKLGGGGMRLEGGIGGEGLGLGLVRELVRAKKGH